MGLDTEMGKLPANLPMNADGMLSFNKAIIDATAPYCVSFKINTAFYEQYGSQGWEVMEETLKYIPEGFFTIADAKRGDIGNTSLMYARAFLENMQFDAITVSPYMGADSIEPFYKVADKFVIALGLTSNPGSADLQMQKLEDGSYVFEQTIKKICSWGTPENTMIVAGATHGDLLKKVRQAAPAYFLLVPGVGAQGGSLSEVVAAAMNAETGLLVNASRSVIYASSGADYAQAAGAAAKHLQQQMAVYL